ncbi:class I lanthipeptide, partial [Chryseobacterium sp.]
MNNKSVKLGKSVTLNKDAVTKLQEDQLNKVKGGIKDIDQDMQ